MSPPMRGNGSMEKTTSTGTLEVAGDPQGEVQAGAVLAPLEVADRLVVDAERVGELAAGDALLGAQHGDAVVDGVASPDPLQRRLAGGLHLRAGLAPRHPPQHDRRDEPCRRPPRAPSTSAGLRACASSRRSRAPRPSRAGTPSACRGRASTSGRSARPPGPSPTAAWIGKKIPEMPASTRTGSIPQVPTFCVLGTSEPMIIPIGSVASSPSDEHPRDGQPARRAAGHEVVEEQEARARG